MHCSGSTAMIAQFTLQSLPAFAQRMQMRLVRSFATALFSMRAAM